MDDIDDLLATLTMNNNNTRPQTSQPKSQFNYGQINNNKKDSIDLDFDSDGLGGYNPSGITNNKQNDKKLGFGGNKPSTSSGQGQYNVDDVLKIFDDNDDDQIFGKAGGKKNDFSSKQPQLKDKSKSTNNAFFDEFDLDFDDKKNTDTYGKSTGYIPSSTGLDNKKGGFSMKKDDDDYLEKKASLFGVPSTSKITTNTAPNPKQYGGASDNFSVGSSRDLFKEKDSSPIQLDNFGDFKKRDNTKHFSYQQTFNSENKFANEKSKSVLDEDDDLIIDNVHSRRGRSSARKVSTNLNQKDDRSNSPLVAPSSAKRSLFEENPPKTNKQLEDDNEFGDYNPTLSRLPSRNRGASKEKQVENTQKPPRLLKTHDEFDAPAKPGFTSNNIYNDKNLFEENKNKNNLFSEKTDLFGDANGGRNVNRLGNNTLFRERNYFNDEFGTDNNNNNKFDEGNQNSNNRFASAQIQLKTDKSSQLDSLEKTSETNLLMQKPNNLFAQKNQSDYNSTQPKFYNDAPAKQITYKNSGMQGQANLFSTQQPQFAQVQDQYHQEQSFRNTEIFNKETVSQDFFKSTKVFDETKKQIQEETMHQMTMIRNNYEGQIQLMRINHEEQLQHEKKLRENIIEEMQNLLKTEKERIKILHDSELKSKEQTWEYEKQQLQRTLQQESDMLRKQLEQQQKMMALAEEIKFNTDKLNSLTNKYDNQNENKKSIDHDLREREERQVNLEKKLRIDLDYQENERIRLNKMREDLDSRENLLREQIDSEKQLLKREYNRLQELQDQITSQDQEKKRQLIIERQEFINQKNTTQDERLKLKEEYEQKYREFEMQIILFDKQKQVHVEQVVKLEAMYKTKIQEVEEIRQKLIDQEQTFIKKQKILELKELELSRKEIDCKKISGVSLQERNELDNEQRKLTELQKQVYKEQQNILDFRQTFQQEKDRLERLQNELFVKEKKIQQDVRHIETEKHDLQMMQRTLQSLKSDAIKEFDPKKLSVLNASLISQAYEENSFLTRKENINTSNMNYQLSNNRHPRSSSMHGFKKDNGLNETLNNNFMQSGNIMKHTEQQGFKKPPLNQTHNRGLSYHDQSHQYKIAINQDQNQNNSKNSTNYTKQFNLNEFMTQLKAIDQNSNFNQAYISKERENLFIRDQFGSDYGNSHNQNARSSSYTQSHFYDSSPYLNKPSNSSVESHL